jgi:hypothetical protein
MRFPFYCWLAIAAVLATSSPVLAQARDQQTGERPTASDDEARKAKIEAITVKQKVTENGRAKREEVESKGSGPKSSAPIGVNEPGVNRAPKPLTVTEEGVENQPTKGKRRSVAPTKQAGSEEKPGKGEPQPAKNQ